MDLKMTENKIILQQEQLRLHGVVTKAYKRFRRVSSVAQKLKLKYLEYKLEYEEVDFRLAMVDGRYKVIERGRSSKVPNAEEIILRLNKAQILRIAAELGVEIEEGGDT